MSDHSTKRENGYSLLEMVVSLALGAIVLGAAVQIYIQGVQATWATTQRSELQGDFRAASNMLTKDLGLAAAGLSPVWRLRCRPEHLRCTVHADGNVARAVLSGQRQQRVGAFSDAGHSGLSLRAAAGI